MDWYANSEWRQPLNILWESINQKLRGYYNYYGVSDSWSNLLRFKREIIKATYQWLKRRGQRSKLDWDRFNEMLEHYPLENPKSLINLNSAFV